MDEHLSSKQIYVGSIPTRRTREKDNMKKADKNTIKKIDYLLEKLMYIKHDAGNCKCQSKKHKTLNHILGILNYEKYKVINHTPKAEMEQQSATNRQNRGSTPLRRTR